MPPERSRLAGKAWILAPDERYGVTRPTLTHVARGDVTVEAAALAPADLSRPDESKVQQGSRECFILNCE